MSRFYLPNEISRSSILSLMYFEKTYRIIINMIKFDYVNLCLKYFSLQIILCLFLKAKFLADNSIFQHECEQEKLPGPEGGLLFY